MLRTHLLPGKDELRKLIEINMGTNGIKKERGTFLIVMLVVYGLLWAAHLLTLLNPSHYPKVYADGPSFSYLFNLIIFLFATTSLVAIFTWRKWGIYVLSITTAISILFDIAYFPHQVTLLGHIVSLIPIGLIIWAISRKWSYYG
jgi:p-aminobenzoyl-glutamate transporter AbgT